MAIFNKITIVGVGLIGASLAKAIRKKRIAKKIVGYFRNEKKLKKALSKRIVDSGSLDLEESISQSDLVILALPIRHIISFMKTIKKLKNNKTILIDVGSTKSKVVDVATKLNLNFVGTHPLAGSEKKSADFSSVNLFNNSLVIITPTKKTNKKSLAKVLKFWKKLNTKTTSMAPAKHDKILSFTSHLPHLSSFCLINSIPEAFLPFGATGLKDSTRIASSDAQIWADIFLSNKKELLTAIKALENQIKKIKKAVLNNKRSRIVSLINSSRKRRGKIN